MVHDGYDMAVRLQIHDATRSLALMARGVVISTMEFT